jgi:hypothetical protein
MSTTSDLSSGPPLCYCGVPARLRNSWTETNPTRKWYGCINYKVNLEISFVLYVVVSSLRYLPSFSFFFSSCRELVTVTFLNGLIRRCPLTKKV